MKIIIYIATILLVFSSISGAFAKPADLKKVEKEISELLQNDWFDIVSNGETLSFCSSYIIKTNNQLQIIETERRTQAELINYLANEKITCLDTDKKVSLVKLAKHTKQILHKYGLSTSIERKWLEMRPYYIDRELYDAVTKDNLDLYLRLLAYGAYYGNTSIGHSVINLALTSEAYNIVDYLLKVEQIDLNLPVNGDSSSLSLIIDQQTVRYDLLEYALKKLNADPNYNGDHGSFPIIVAFKHNDEKSMALLIKYGAKVNLNVFEHIGCAKEMLMDQAIKKGDKKIIRLLRRAGAKTYNECHKH